MKERSSARRPDVTALELVGGIERSLLQSRWDDMNAYADAKTDVILAIKARARAARPLAEGGAGPRPSRHP